MDRSDLPRLLLAALVATVVAACSFALAIDGRWAIAYALSSVWAIANVWALGRLLVAITEQRGFWTRLERLATKLAVLLFGAAAVVAFARHNPLAFACGFNTVFVVMVGYVGRRAAAAESRSGPRHDDART